MSTSTAPTASTVSRNRTMNRPTTLRRIVPTLFALGALGAGLNAVEPTITVSGGSTGSGDTVTFTVDWGVNIYGWDPSVSLAANDSAATNFTVANGDFRVYVRNSQAASVTAVSAADADGADTGWKIIPITAADVTAATATSYTVSFNMATKAALTSPLAAVATVDQVWVQIPNQSAHDAAGADLTVTTITPRLIYTKLPAPVVTYAAFTQPISETNHTAYLTKRPTVTASINIDDNEDVDPIDLSGRDAINKSVNTTMPWTAQVWVDDDAGSDFDANEVKGTATFYKRSNWTTDGDGEYATAADSTLARQLVDIPLTTDLAYGTHTLRLRILDPSGQVPTPAAGTANDTPKLLVWERPTIAVNGTPMVAGATTNINRTNNIEFTGSKFNLTGGSEDSTITLTITTGGTTQNVSITANGTDADTSFKATVASLAANTAHTVTLTQTSAATGAPTVVTTYTLNNSTTLDATAPVDSVITSPARGATVDYNKPTITGQAEPGATIEMQAISTDGGTTRTHSGTITANTTTGIFSIGSGAWSGALSAGKTYTLQVRATDAAANISEWSDDTYSITVPTEVVVPRIALVTAPVTVGGVLYSKQTGNPTFNLDFAKLDGTDYGADAVSGLIAGDFTVTGGTLAITTSTDAANHVLTLTPTTGATSVSIALAADKLSIGGVSNNAATTYTYVRDIAAPTVTAKVQPTSGTSTTSVTNGFDVVLTSNEAIYTVDTAQALTFTVAGGGSISALGTPTSVVSTDKKTITLTYAGITTSGTVNSITLTTVPANLLKDIAENGNASTTVTGQTKTFDTTAPSITTITSTATSVSKTSPIPFLFTFSEAVTNFDSSKIKITNGVLSGITGSGASYTVNVTPGEGPTAVKVEFESGATVKDTTGKVSGSLSGSTSGVNYLTRTYDSTPPRVISLTSSTPAPTSSDDKPTNKTAIPCSIVFSEALSTTLIADHFKVENATISNVSGSGSAYTFDLNVAAPTTASKKVRAVYQAGKASDSATNTNSSVAVLVRNYDGVVPTVSGSSSSALTGTNTTAELSATFILNIADSDVFLDKVDISKLNPSSGTIASVTMYDAIDGGGSAITTGTTTAVKSLSISLVNIPRIPGQVISMEYAAGLVKDKATNSNVAGQVDLTIAATN